MTHKGWWVVKPNTICLNGGCVDCIYDLISDGDDNGWYSVITSSLSIWSRAEGSENRRLITGVFFFFYAPPQKVVRYYVILSEILSVCLSVYPSICQHFIISCPLHNWYRFTLNITISTLYSCQLHNSDTILDIFTKLHTNVKHHETMCRTHVVTLVCLLLELLPFEH